MSDAIVQQMIVPSYVWDDEKQKGALLTVMARAMLARAAEHGWTVDVDKAMIEPHMLAARVGHCDVNGEDVSFVGYERTNDPQQCDLMMILLTAETES